MDKATSQCIFGVLGYPVAHSLSPAMHNAALKFYRLEATYLLFEVPPKELGSFFRSLRQKNICGLNVTVPYKEDVIAYLDTLSPEAQAIGAVNTVKVSEKGLEGFNTDGAGFLKHLTEDLGFNPQDKTISIIGAGGAAKAISVYLCKANPKRISFYDVNREKLMMLISRLQDTFPDIEIRVAESIEDLRIVQSQLLVNATPVGMNPADTCLVGDAYLHAELLVYDLIYTPQPTPLLRRASQAGAWTANGLGMLLYQGMLAFEIWTGQQAPKEVMWQALQEGIHD
jgi:shikimate dehydrogenase